MEEVCTTISIPVTPEGLFDVLSALRPAIGPCRARRRCDEFRVLIDAFDNTSVVVRERWRDVAAFEDHVRSDLYQHVLNAIDLAADRPDVRIEFVGRIAGLEIVRKLRARAKSGSFASANALKPACNETSERD